MMKFTITVSLSESVLLFQVRDWREATGSVVGQGVHGTTEPEEAKHYRYYTSKNELRGVIRYQTKTTAGVITDGNRSELKKIIDIWH